MAGREFLPDIDVDAPVYGITVAAQLANLHPQTLRQYDRLGLVSPARSPGRGRRYSHRDVERLRRVQALSQDGVNLERAWRPRVSHPAAGETPSCS